MEALLLLVFIAIIELTKGDCNDYLNLTKLDEKLTRSISLRKPKDPKDIIECTLERECLTQGQLCNVFYHCINDTESREGSKEISEKCQGEDFKNISLYNLLCLTAKAGNHPSEGCYDYETVCMLYSEKPSNLYDRKASGHTTTTTTTTTAASPRTTTAASPRTTTATATTQLTTKSETTALSLSSTTAPSLPTTTKETTDKDSTLEGKMSESNADASPYYRENLIWKIFCGISVIGNVACLVYFCLLQRRDRIHSANRPVSEAGEVQPLQLPQSSNSNSVEMNNL